MGEASSGARRRTGRRLRPEEVVEPRMSDEDRADFERGLALFNRGAYWESHEAWERVWRRHTEPNRVFFQGLIQLAAAYHQLGQGIQHGVVVHLNNARAKLEQFRDEFLGLDVSRIVVKIAEGIVEAERLGEGRLDRFDPSLVARIDFRGHGTTQRTGDGPPNG